MTGPRSIDLWIHGACAAGGYGGWSYVARADNQWSGVAGGASRTDVTAMVLTALATALDAYPGLEAIRLTLADPSLLDPADDHPAVRARIAKVLAGGPVDLAVIDARRAANAAAWAAFLGSWADFARDKAKTRGAFSAAIPRLNIAKFVQDAI